jgi:hypothetical protein
MLEALPLRERAVFKLLIETECRKSEALAARWEDADTAGRLWTLRSPKAGRLQVVPLPPTTARMLNELKGASEAELEAAKVAPARAVTPKEVASAEAPMKQTSAAWEWLFPSARPGQTKQTPATEVKGLWSRVRKAAKPPSDLTLHDLRRTFGLEVAKRAGILAAAELLRHSDAHITSQVYTPLAMEDLRGVCSWPGRGSREGAADAVWSVQYMVVAISTKNANGLGPRDEQPCRTVDVVKRTLDDLPQLHDGFAARYALGGRGLRDERGGPASRPSTLDPRPDRRKHRVAGSRVLVRRSVQSDSALPRYRHVGGAPRTRQPL